MRNEKKEIEYEDVIDNLSYIQRFYHIKEFFFGNHKFKWLYCIKKTGFKYIFKYLLHLCP